MLKLKKKLFYRMDALATPGSPLSFETALAIGQSGGFYPSTSISTYKNEAPVFSRQNDEDWC